MLESENKMTENRYQHSKVYKLVDQINGYYYIGSTACSTLSKRLMWHKQDASKVKNKSIKKYEYFNSVGWKNVKIILIEEYKFNNKMELLREEDKLIQQHRNDAKCLNVLRAYVTNEEKHIYNIEKGKEYRSLHLEELQEYDRQRNQQKIMCECGLEYAVRFKLHHEKTIQHVNYIKKKNGELVVEYIDCECGKRVLTGNMNRHLKSLQHADFINGTYSVTCECGSIVSKQHLKRHMKTAKHKELLENKL